jgi:hypothetical protein
LPSSENREVAAGAFGCENFRHAREPGPVAGDLAVDFDFEMAESVEAHALDERLRQTVVDAVGGREVGGVERVRQTDGVARPHVGWRSRREPVARRGAGEGGLEFAEVDAEEIFAQGGGERRRAGAAERIDQRALHERGAEICEQRRQAGLAAPRDLGRVQRAPIRPRGRRAQPRA